MSDFKPKFHQIRFQPGAPPQTTDHAGELTALPQTL